MCSCHDELTTQPVFGFRNAGASSLRSGLDPKFVDKRQEVAVDQLNESMLEEHRDAEGVMAHSKPLASRTRLRVLL